MKKIILYLTLVLLACSIVFSASLKECQRTMIKSDIPCIQPTSWLPGDSCTNYNISIIDQQNNSIENLTYYQAPTSCQFIFTHNTPNIYYWNSSIESGIITVEANNNMLAIIIVYILMIVYFAVIGYINTISHFKFLAYSLSIIELILMVGTIYVSEGGGDYLPLLKINFYATLIIGFGLGMATFFIKSAQEFSDEPILPSDSDSKWGDSKW